MQATRFLELSQGDFLYQKGDAGRNFFFVLKGKLELLVQEGGDQFKFSKNVDEFEFFGIKTFSSDNRHDFAKVVTEKCWIIVIDKDFFD